MKSINNKKFISKYNRRNKIKQVISLSNQPFELNLDSYALGINEEFKLRPKMMTKATLEWSSDNEDVATVDELGNVTPISLGTCNIICKKGNKISKCELTIEEEELLKDLKLESCKFGIEVKNGAPVLYCPVLADPQLTINGVVNIENNIMKFDGSQSITTNGITSYYGFGKNETLVTQRIYIKFKIDEYPAEGTTYNLLNIKKSKTDGVIKINSNGGLLYDNLDIPHISIPINEWNELIICVGNIKNIGWSLKIKHGDIVAEYYGEKGREHWGSDMMIGDEFKGEIEFVYSHSNKSNTSPLSDFDDEFYSTIDNYIFNNRYKHISSAINSGRTRNLLDYEITNPLNVTWNLSDSNKDITKLDFVDKSIFTYDIEELDEYGYITKVYKNALTLGKNIFALDNDYNTPQRWYKHLRLRDNINKKYINDEDLCISTIDSTITNNNDGVPAYLHISPTRIQSRVGEYVLMQPTFAPYNNYKDPRCEWSSSDESIAVIDADGLVTCKAIGVCIITAVPIINKALKATATIIVKEAIDESLFPLIDIEEYDIIPNNEDAEVCYNNIINIQNALFAYKEMGYKGCKLPNNLYNINSIYNKIVKYINIPSNFVFDMNGSIFNQLGGDSGAHNHVFNIHGADNSILKNGIVYGDRYTHNYGIRINENPGSYEDGLPNSLFEIGCIDHTDGITLVEKSTIDGTLGVRTKDFITEFPSSPFKICPLWNTTMNSVDGGRAIVYWYDEEGNFISYADRQFIGNAHSAPEGATKMKLVIRNEQRLDPVFFMTTDTIYPTHEFASGIQIGDSFNFKIENMTLKNFQGDCILTHDTNSRNNGEAINDLRIINCICENGRRQGISFVGTQDNCLIKGCKIGRINGTDPQCGIDFEAYARNEKFLIDDCDFYDNRKWDIVDCFSGQIEVRNSRFNGSIGLGQTSYNWYVHNNEFIYDDKYIDSEDYVISRYKIHNSTGCGLYVNGKNGYYYYSILESNNVDGKIVNRGGLSVSCPNNAICHNNIVYNGTLNGNADITNCEVHGKISISNDNGAIYENCLFNNTDKIGTFNIRQKVSYIKNCTLNNITVGGIARCEDSTITSSSITAIKNSNDGGNPLMFTNCTINNPTNMNICNNFPGKVRIEGCEINLTRSSTSNIYYDHDVGFKDCIINFSASGPEGEINWLRPGYSDYTCALWFEDCTFVGAEKFPVKINTRNYNDGCKFEGSAIPGAREQITEFTMDDINGIKMLRNTSLPLNMNILPNNHLNVFLDVTPLTNQINLSTGADATESKLSVQYPSYGDYHLKFYTKDGSNLVKEFDISIVETLN